MGLLMVECWESSKVEKKAVQRERKRGVTSVVELADDWVYLMAIGSAVWSAALWAFLLAAERAVLKVVWMVA
jgi:hypothetical protein